MTFLEQREALLDFIKDNYKNYLSEAVTPFYTTEFLDFDKFKGDFTVFIDFSRIDFRESPYRDDCRDMEHLSLTIYLVRRNSETETLRADVLDFAFGLYQMIRDTPELGVAQDTTIESIDFYNYVEGTKNLVCAEFSLSMEIEI